VVGGVALVFGWAATHLCAWPIRRRLRRRSLGIGSRRLNVTRSGRRRDVASAGRQQILSETKGVMLAFRLSSWLPRRRPVEASESRIERL
jgi:hypothetical protein